MSREEQKSLRNLAKDYINADRSKEQILATLKAAGILTSDGNVAVTYSEIIKQAK